MEVARQRGTKNADAIRFNPKKSLKASGVDYESSENK